MCSSHALGQSRIYSSLCICGLSWVKNRKFSSQIPFWPSLARSQEMLLNIVDICTADMFSKIEIHPLCFLRLLTLLRLSMAKSKISLGKCHVALGNMWVIFKYLLILISNIIPQWWERTLYDFNTSRLWNFAPCFMSMGMSVSPSL